MRKLIIAFLSLLYISTVAQVGIHQWREHLPYNNGLSVSKAKNRVYCSTNLSLFYLNLTDNSLNRLNKINGLSDINFSLIKYHKSTDNLIIAYTNGNIDILKNDIIYNMSDIKRKNIIGSKKINNITFKDNLAYLSLDFGIVVLDPVKREILDTWYIGSEGSYIQVYDFDYNDSIFVASTESGIYYAPINGVNHAFYENWTKDTLLPNPDGRYNTASFYKDKLVVNCTKNVFDSDSVFIKENNVWTYFNQENSLPKYAIKSYGDTLVFVNYNGFKYYYNDLSESFIGYTYNQADGIHDVPYPRDIIRTADGKFFIADLNHGLVYNYKTWGFRYYSPEGPQNADVFAMDIQNSNLWVASGGINQSWNNVYSKKGIYSFIDEHWKSINKLNNSAFDTISDVVAVAVDPLNSNKVYFGTWGKGLIEVENNEVKNIYQNHNSAISSADNRPNYYAIKGLAFDDQNNLWLTNSATSNGLVVKKTDGTWQSFSLSPYVVDNFISDLVIDHNNQKWIIIPPAKGIIVYNDNNTIENTADDRIRLLNTNSSNGGLHDSHILSIAVDRDGQIWVGTIKGVAVFYSPENVFNSEYDLQAQQIYVEEAGISQYLLESEEVNCIAVDGANNKWFGTKNSGVFYMSEDGSKQIYHFTEENSPLLSNNIYAITVDNKSGEVFFGTEKGIVSFRNVATEAKENSLNAKVYPNPVKESYNGPIAIKNLSRDANVKITDLNSNVVFEGFAEGGQIIWNGTNLNGNRVSTGVYLVFISNEDGSQTMVSKILFAR